MAESLAPGPATAGLRLRPDRGLRSRVGGTVLVGGSPYRLMRLGPAGARQVTAWWAGAPVAGPQAVQALARRLLAAGMAHPVPDTGPDGAGRGTGPGRCHRGHPGPGPDGGAAALPGRVARMPGDRRRRRLP